MGATLYIWGWGDARWAQERNEAEAVDWKSSEARAHSAGPSRSSGGPTQKTEKGDDQGRSSVSACNGVASVTAGDEAMSHFVANKPRKLSPILSLGQSKRGVRMEICTTLRH
ncbi:MAG: hypothetical protein B7Y80_09605 [Hyphomicrobium sp. 32-62-53]|nr:MAG: hypothetical protein B7Y80_09605 [Hyphomicrobium sp. 32-62-53]